MHDPTHRIIAVAVGTGVAVSIHSRTGLMGAGVVVWAAWATAMLPDPDAMEKWFRASHRGWTHWLLTTVLSALALGAIVYGIGYAAAAGVAELMGPKGRELVDVCLQAAVGMGVLIAIGALCGTVTHTLADACTETGVPLLGPFTRRRMFLMPDGWRCTVGEARLNSDGTKMRDKDNHIVYTGKRGKGEKRWARGALLVVIVLVGSQFLPELVAFWRGVLEAIDAAQPR